MKKTLSIIVTALIIISPSLVFASAAPTDAEYDEAASIAGNSFICDSLPDVQMKILQYEFIKKPKTQKLAEVCTYGSTAYVLLQETVGKKKKVSGGMFIFAPSDFMKGEGKFKVIESSKHPLVDQCNLQDSTQSAETEVSYVCLSNDSAPKAKFIKAIRYSFKIANKKTSSLTCRISTTTGQITGPSGCKKTK